MSTFSNFLGNIGFKTSPNDEYQKNTLSVIEEAVKVEKLLKSYIDQQRVFTDSLVEWTASKDPCNKSLANLSRILSQINFEWTKSQEVFRESISRLRHEFEVIATDMGDREYFETRYESAKKEFDANRKKLEKGNKISEADQMKVVEKERRKRRDLEEYLANRENQTMVKVKRSFHGLAHGFMHQGASSFNIYQAFQTALSTILPDDEYHLNPIILKPSDYLAISEGRAESSLAIEKGITRSRAQSLANRSHSAPSLTEACTPEVGTLEVSTLEVGTPEVERKRKNKRKKKHRRPLSADAPNSTFESPKADPNASESEHPKSYNFEKPVTPTSVSGTIKSSSIDNQSFPITEGFEASPNTAVVEPPSEDKEVRSPMPKSPGSELSPANLGSPTSEVLSRESPVEHV